MSEISEIEIRVKEILSSTRSESSNLDYRLFSYDIKNEKHRVIKDVIAMLNYKNAIPNLCLLDLAFSL